MDQIYQLQRQIQDLRQEINNINQVASQLQRSEANNAVQLQRLQQNEAMAAQQLQTIQQLCSRLSQDVNVLSNVAQQVTSQIINRPMTTGQFGTTPWGQYATGQFGAYNPGITTSQYGPQFGAFSSQLGNRDEFSRNQQISQMAANRYGMGLNVPEYASNQQISSMVNQGALSGAYGMGAATGLAGTQYTTPAYGTGQWSATGQVGAGLMGSQPSFTIGAHNMGRYSNF